MGLDWVPLNKPKPGSEAEFARLFHKLGSKSRWFRESRLARFQAIGVTPYVTLGAPRIGASEAADRWAVEQYELRRPELPREEWMAQLRGLHALPLVAPCAGIPCYSNGELGGYVEPYAFRAEFLTFCAPVLDEALLQSAYETKLAPAALAYADALAEIVHRHAAAAGVEIPADPPEDHESSEGRLHIVDAAARWCRWWAERGHGFEAYW